MSKSHFNPSDFSDKPSKPNPEFPLFAHANGCWAKKIRGKMHYFGVWADPDGALNKYLEQKDALHAGRDPRPDPEAATVKEVANWYLNAKRDSVAAGELSPRTWADYRSIMDMLVKGLGKHTPVATLDPRNFAALKRSLARRNGPARMSTIVQVIRCAFRHAFESGAIERPLRFGPDFKRTSKKTLRLHRAKQGPKLFDREEILLLLLATRSPVLEAMFLLGINCGFGNADCGRLRVSAVDLDRGIIDYPRPKTGIARRCSLWPETVAALREALSKRPTPKDPADAGLVFLTRRGQPWDNRTSANPVSEETKKLLKALCINGSRNFYSLRHTFRTIADEAKDQPAADFIMGHETPHMSSVYREKISDGRLRAVADYVRTWLFGKQNTNVV